jgi:hypothetical protein
MAWVGTIGYVNLATASAAFEQGGDWWVRDGNGKEQRLAGIYSGDTFLSDSRETVIPAPGTQKLFALCAPDENHPDFLLETYPIIAWRITGELADPIIPGTRWQDFGNHWFALIELPTGHFLEAGFEGSCFGNMNEAKAHLMSSIKRNAEFEARIAAKRAEKANQVRT